MMTGVSLSTCLVPESTESPSDSGILRSVSTRSYALLRIRSSARFPSVAVSTRYPSPESVSVSIFRIESLSSTTKIVGMFTPFGVAVHLPLKTDLTAKRLSSALNHYRRGLPILKKNRCSIDAQVDE